MAKDSLARAAGDLISVTLNGKEYRVKPLTLGDLAEFESRIKSDRIKAFQEASAEFAPDLRRATLIDLISRALTSEEVTAEMSTLSGIRFLFWQMLVKEQPELVLDDMSRIVDLQNLGEIEAMVQTLGAPDEENPPQAPPENDSDGITSSAS